MSTTIKRIALVAVAALGLGVVSVAPSQAVTQADSLTLSATSASQLTGETLTAGSASFTLSYLGGATTDSMTVSAFLVSQPAGNTVLPVLALAETTSALVTADGASTTRAIGYQATGQIVGVQPRANTSVVSAKFNVYLNAPTVAGTYVIRLIPAVTAGGGTLNAVAQNLTITVAQNPNTDTVAASATSIINAGETISATADVTVTGTKTPAAGTNNVAAATIKVDLLNAAGKAVTAESYTATIAGPGLLGSSAWSGTTLADTVTATGRAITVRNGDVVAVFPDGTSGVGTITISSAAGKVLATETVTFFGDVAKIVTTVKKAVIGGTSEVADVLSIVVTDAAGVSVSNLSSVNVVSSNTAAIAGAYTAASVSGKYSTTTGSYLVPLTPVAAGTANITVTTKSSATATTGVDAAAVSVRVGSKTPASVTVTTDKASYAPGEKATITVQLFDANGLELAGDETYTAIFATGGITSNYTLGTGSATISGTGVVSYAAGGKTYDVYLPVTEGDVKFSWTTGSTAAASTTGLATANQGVAGSVTVAVSSAATSAAIDAANEAAQAASDATDAALAAADAADAATTKAQEAVDAVATLSAQVSKMISALRAQLTTLTNLVIKIQKKVRA
jgi:hypothetical protein